MKQRILYMTAQLAVIAGLLLVSCTSNEPEYERDLTMAVTPESTLDMLLEYFPFRADAPFVYVNDQSGERCCISPAEWTGVEDFPTYESRSDTISSEYVHWVSQSKAYMIADSVSFSYYHFTRLECIIKNEVSGLYDFGWTCAVWLPKEGGFWGYFKGNGCDSTEIWKSHPKILTIPITRHADANARGGTEPYDVPNAVIHVVKGKGIYDFSLDGISTWRLEE